MSRDILIRGNVVTVIYRSPTDFTAVPDSVSIISEADWRALVGEPEEGETFASRELSYIASRGWVVDDSFMHDFGGSQ